MAAQLTRSNYTGPNNLSDVPNAHGRNAYRSAPFAAKLFWKSRNRVGGGPMIRKNIVSIGLTLATRKTMIGSGEKPMASRRPLWSSPLRTTCESLRRSTAQGPPGGWVRVCWYKTEEGAIPPKVQRLVAARCTFKIGYARRVARCVSWKFHASRVRVMASCLPNRTP